MASLSSLHVHVTATPNTLPTNSNDTKNSTIMNTHPKFYPPSSPPNTRTHTHARWPTQSPYSRTRRRQTPSNWSTYSKYARATLFTPTAQVSSPYLRDWQDNGEVVCVIGSALLAANYGTFAQVWAHG